ncbi:MAG: HNH endonuclease [Saprospiraceae bacterium]|nr:HNH endonuclease [Saprospiraceae bacterium]
MANKYVSKKNKDFIRKLAHGCCEYCQSQEAYSTQNFSMEHIIPTHLDGSNEIDNLALSCQGCNNIKFTKIGLTDETTDEFIPFFHPRQDIWIEHFKWNDDFTLIIPLTKKGEVTLKVLKMNREQVVNWRTAVLSVGKHPPLHTIVD